LSEIGEKQMSGMKAKAVQLDELPRESAAVEALLERRREERRQFLVIIHSKQAAEYSKDDAYFASLVTMAVKDYGVSRRSLATMLGANESAISRWMTGAHAPRPYGRKEVIAAIADLLRQDLAAEDAGQHRPRELQPEGERSEERKRAKI
jgi:ribosome-binding protein aMBF1 (putative translation factor)